MLDGVDAEVGFQVQVDVEEVGGVAGLFGHDRQHLLLDPVPGRRHGRGLGDGRSRRGRSFGDGSSRHRSWRGRRFGLSRGDRLRGRCHGWRGRTLGGWAVVADPQRALGDLSDRGRQPAGCHQPRLPSLRVDDAVLEAELVGLGVAATRGRHDPIQGHAHLRPEAGTEPKGVADRVRTTLGQVELAQVGVRHLVVRHRGHDPGFDRLDGHDVLDPDAHGVAGEALGVGDHHLAGRVTEDMRRFFFFFSVVTSFSYVVLLHPEDVKAILAPAVLAHRITVKPELWISENVSGPSASPGSSGQSHTPPSRERMAARSRAPPTR